MSDGGRFRLAMAPYMKARTTLITAAHVVGHSTGAR